MCWCNLEELYKRISRTKKVHIYVDNVEGQMRMAFKIFKDNIICEELYTLRRKFCDMNTGEVCDGFVESDDDNF